MAGVVAAVDLGATSGRVILGHVGEDRLEITTAHRFPNVPVATADGLHWNILELYRQVLDGLRAAVRTEPEVAGVAVDSWAVDYALMRDGRMLGTPFHYRDGRSERSVPRVHERVGFAELYARNGLQFLPFNTVYQLADDGDLVEAADSLLMMPDLLTYWLSGHQIAEATNASTTGLLDVHTRRWDDELIARLDLPRAIFHDPVAPGTTVGPVRPEVAAALGGPGRLEVGTVGSHDTASAVVGVPMADDAAYISCGTWGLVGVEVDEPVVTDESREANFTNEGGVDGRVRYLRNVMGLWLLSESVRTWEAASGERIDLSDLIAAAGQVTDAVPVIDVDDPRFLPPGDIPSRVAEYCGERGLPVPASRAALVRCILESLAQAFAGCVETAARLSGVRVEVIHLVGGGSQNALLCQLTADRSGTLVLAGPVEATALGNVLVQGRSLGLVSGDLEALRARVAVAYPPARFVPRSNREAQR